MRTGRGRVTGLAAALLMAGLACNGSDSSGPKSKTNYGIVLVRATTTGTDPDDRYDVSIGTEHRVLSAQGYATFTVTPGTMVVNFDGVAPNCVIDGQSTRTITVEAGQTATVEFTVGCLATGLLIRTHTIGSDFPDRYNVVIPGFNPRSIGVNDELTFSRLAPGTYTLSLNFPGENCVKVGQPQVAAAVTNRNLTPVLLDVTCTKPTRLEKIAFIDDSLTSAHRLFLSRPDGSDPKFLGEAVSPSWSPDGAYLAYIKTECDSYYYYYYYVCANQLWMTDPEVGRSKQVGIPLSLNVHAAAWSPAGNLIALIHVAEYVLYLISPEGGSPTLVSTAPALQVNDPSWSPDGENIAVSCMIDNDNWDICTFSRFGTGFRRLTANSVTEFDPAWSPDGKTIAFVTNANGKFEIATMATDGTGVRILTEGFSPSWSRGGTSIAFSRDLGTFTIKPDGSALTKITSGKQRDVAWRP